MLETVIDFLVAACILVACAGVGSKVLSAVGLSLARPSERVAFSLGAGSLIVSLVILAVGSFVGVGQATLAAVFFAAMALCLAEIRKFIDDLLLFAGSAAKIVSRAVASPLSLQSVCVLGIAALLALHFISTLAPPASSPLGSNDWDSLGYHLTAPEQYLLRGKIVFLSSMYQANWPLAVQMLYLPALAFGSAVAAKLVAFGLSLALVFAVFLLGKRVLKSNEGGVASAAVLLSSQAVSVAFSSASVDLPGALYSALAFFALVEWRDTRKWKWLAVAGFFVGGVGASKITSLLFIPAFALAAAWVAYCNWRNSAGVHVQSPITTAAKKVRQKMRDDRVSFPRAFLQLKVFCLIAAAVVAPWLLRTWAYTGNPVWPFYNQVFAQLGFADNGAAAWTSSFGKGVIGVVGLSKNLINLLLSPLYITLQGRLFEGVITPLLLALIPLAFLFKRPRNIGFLLGASAVGYITWFFSLQTVRYLLPVIPALCVAAAFSIISLQKQATEVFRGAARMLPTFLILIALLGSLGVAFAYKSDSLPVALGLESKESYLLRSQYNYAAAQWVDKNLPQQARLLMVNDYHGFYYKRQVVYDAFAIETHGAYALSQQEFEQFVKNKLLATHIVLNTKVSFRQDHLHAQETEVLVNGLVASSTLVHQANGIEVYELK